MAKRKDNQPHDNGGIDQAAGGQVYSVGVDLGTTNSVIAYTPIGDAVAPPTVLPVPQVVAASTLADRAALPSFLYLATDAEKQSAVFDVPWQKGARLRRGGNGAEAIRGCADAHDQRPPKAGLLTAR